MKKLLLILCLLLISTSAHAGGGMMLGIVGGGTPAAAGGTGVIGQIDHSGTGYGGQTGFYMFEAFTTTTAGAVSYGHIHYTSTGSTKLVISIHNSTTGAMLRSGSTTVVGPSGWVNIAMTGGTGELAAATSYWLAFQTTVAGTLGAVNNASSVRYHTESPMQDPAATITDEGEGDNYKVLAILFNNTAGSPE